RSLPVDPRLQQYSRNEARRIDVAQTARVGDGRQPRALYDLDQRPGPRRPLKSGLVIRELGAMELTVNPEAVVFIIEKAREFDAKVEPDDPESGSNPSDDKAIDVLEDLADDPTLEELKGAIDGLNE